MPLSNSRVPLNYIRLVIPRAIPSENVSCQARFTHPLHTVCVNLVYWLRHLFGSRTQRFGWLLLAGQLLLLTMHGWPIGPYSWWNHDPEYNIPAVFATFQVLAGSFCALAIVILSPLRPRWLRGYWVLISLGLFVLAQDEFGVLHEHFPILEEFYLIGGALVAGLSVIVWRHLDSRGRRYHRRLGAIPAFRP